MKMMIQSQWNPQMAQKTQMLVKTPEIPMWSKTLKYEYFKCQIEGWNQDSKETDKKKFDRLIESFKKNSEIDGLKNYATTVILSKCKTSEKQNVTRDSSNS